MRLQLTLAAGTTLLWLLAGCGGTRVRPLGGGYDEVLVTYRGMGEVAMTQHKLRYTDSHGHRAIVWEWVFSDIFIRDGVAVFIGEDPAYAMRVFAVKPPELPLDITTQIVGGWAQASGKNVSQATAGASTRDAKQTGDGKMEFYFAFDQGILPETNITMEWNQLSNMMRRVKEHGVEGKDRRFGRYLTEVPQPGP